MDSQNCYFFVGGGTGGHLTPGLAVARTLLADEPNARILFIGSDRPLEQTLVARNGFERMSLPAESLQSVRRHPFRFLWRNFQSYRQACQLLKEHQPRAVIGLGGFASAATVYAAIRRRVPTILLEQNVLPGRATRWFCPRAHMTCLSFAETASYLSKRARTLVTGNPVRPEFVRLFDESPDTRSTAPQTLLILGGSQGAVALNQALLHFAERNRHVLTNWKIVHQTGSEQADEVRRRYAELSLAAQIEPFFEDMAAQIGSATLVISRAGATTLAELACGGTPAILVPYPHAADNHQLLNAQAYAGQGAAHIVTQASDAQSTADRLATAVLPLLQNQAALQRMREQMRSLSIPRAAENVLAAIRAASLCAPGGR